MLHKTYAPKSVEEKWIKLWQENKLFSTKPLPDKKSFVIVIPPPNITGALHMGHALNNTLQDILIRYKRLAGENSCWIVGTDHGGIATQNVMEKILKLEGKKKEDLGRENFLKRMWKWYEECGNTILEQLKKLGCAIDFSKENIRFTMDEKRSKAVFQAFKELWEKGLIYRGERMINWCPRCSTALSDIEVEYEEEKTNLWHIKYPIKNTDEFIVVATTRPETMLGDTAVAVNPEDKRYKKLIGKTLILPLVGREIPLIADSVIDMDFGTGAVKVTPGHDPVDFEISLRHNLPQIQVISYEGKIINSPEKYNSKKVSLVRKEIVEDLKQNGFLLKEEPYTHNVGKCYRCSNNIEPLVSEQWFVKTKPLAEKAIEKVKNKEITFYPENWIKPFMDWLENIQDWCISRQIWWGHRIPVWYCIDCNKDKLPLTENKQGTQLTILPGKRNNAIPIISDKKPHKCEKCGGQNFVQDPDVLDTWFSSALWPFSVFNWPLKTQELKYFYPTSVLVTGYEILYLWVARMIMSGLFHLNQIPFSKVYVHGIVRDKHGQKMSKSKGNVIDPLDMMSKYGTDSMRFSLIIQAIGGKDIPFSENSIIGGRNFINKIYNVSRFIQMNINPNEKYELDTSDIDLTDKWILNKYNKLIREYKELMEKYLLPEAIDKLYGFLWDDFCDWYIEFSKVSIHQNTPNKNKKLGILINVFINSLKMLHPFTPFITEEIFNELKNYIKSNSNFIIEERLPCYTKELDYEKEISDVLEIMDIIREIRTLRSQFGIQPQKKIKVIITSYEDDFEKIKVFEKYILALSNLEEIQTGKNIEKPKMAVSGISSKYNIYVLIDGNIDMEKEKTRLKKEYLSISENLKLWQKRINDESFIKNAPKEEVLKLKERIDENFGKINRIENMLKELEK